jgi:putative SOS response-associated peptidase YedK
MALVLELKDVDRWLRDLPEEAAALMRPAKDVLQEWPLGKAISGEERSPSCWLNGDRCMA